MAVRKTFAQYLDATARKAISRKLLVFAVATHALYWGILDANNWFFIAILYLGGQAGLDFFAMHKGTPAPGAEPPNHDV